MAEDSARGGRRVLADPRTRVTVEFILLLVGAEIMRYVAFPARLAGLLFAAAAVVWGLRAYRAAVRAQHAPAGPQRRGMLSPVFVLVGVGLAGLLLVWHTLLATPIVVAYDRCRAEALTQAAEQRCTAEFEERLAGLAGS